MPSRIGFSIWFFDMLFQANIIIRSAYFPPYEHTYQEYSTGAMAAIAATVLWLGRRHWSRVIRCVFGRPHDDEDRYLRVAGITFCLGCGGMFAWLLWVGVQPWVALGIVAVSLIVTLVVSRLVAETGAPLFRQEGFDPLMMMKFGSASWFTAPSAYFAVPVLETIVQAGTRVSAAVMGTHALGLAESNAATPRARARLAWLLLAVLMCGVVIGGAAHVALNYRHEMSYLGRTPVNNAAGVHAYYAQHALMQWYDGEFTRPTYNQAGHLAFGTCFAGGLYWACLVFPRWPLHPIGMLFLGSNLDISWSSVLIGWLLKVVILHYGGARLYRRAVPFFIGLIVGEIVAGAFWSLVPAVLVQLGREYVYVPIVPMYWGRE